ncbi:MAG: hypothetical protein IT170_09920 [Bryobacterales bacterium]|nr:hypothetical protein [Bryobacterales bacterium]
MPSVPNSTQDASGSNLFEFPNPNSPFTHHQQFALEALRQGKSVTAVMEELRYERQTFYDWRNHNPAFKLAVEEARDDFRGVVADCVHDLQQAVHVLLDDCIRAERVPLNLRLRSAALFLRYARSETLLPRRLAAIASAPDGISPTSPITNPSSPTPFPAPDPSEPEPAPPERPGPQHTGPQHTGPQPAEPEITGPQPAESKERTASPSPNPAQANDSPQTAPCPAQPSRPMQEAAPAPTTIHRQKPGETVRSVRIEPAKCESANPEPQRTPAAKPLTSPGIADAPSPASPAHAAPGPSAIAAGASPAIEAPKPEIQLSQTWLSAHFLHGHESPKAFETLLANHIHAHAPATPAEELLVFRVTQKAWLLRRLETWERVIADSRVTKVREQHPNAAAPACIALSLLEAKETSQTRFYQRTAKLREQHEAALDRLTSRLETLQLRRETNRLRDQRANPFPARRPHIPFARLAGCDRDH